MIQLKVVFEVSVQLEICPLSLFRKSVACLKACLTDVWSCSMTKLQKIVCTMVALLLVSIGINSVNCTETENSIGAKFDQTIERGFESPGQHL